MDVTDTFTEESLRRLSYIDLQRCAKMHGVKANVKAEKLIAALVSENTKNHGNSVPLEDVDAIVGSNLISDEHESENSSVKPRRRRTRTFSIEKPVCVETSNVSYITPLKTTNSRCNTPTKSSVKSILSSRKTGKFNKSRKGNCFRVSFITPDKMDLKSGCNTSASSPSSIKRRPQTPAALKYSSGAKRKKCFIASPISETPNKTEKQSARSESSIKYSKDKKANVVCCTEEEKLVKTLLSSSTKSSKKPELIQSHSPMKAILPSSAKSAKKPELIRSCTPNFKKIHQQAFDKMESLDEYQQRKHARTCKLGKTGKRLKKIPIRNYEAKSLPKAFSETCRDKPKENSNPRTLSLRLRKINSSKIPMIHQGIRFAPSVTSIKQIKTDFAKLAETPNIKKSSTTSENSCVGGKSEQSIKSGRDKVFRFGKGTVQKTHPLPFSDVSNTAQNDKSLIRKKKFDLKASLARKLPYKPYTGILKPLSDTKDKDGTVATAVDHQSLPSATVDKKREGTRNILKGVRKNRRFELQMSHRGLAT